MLSAFTVSAPMAPFAPFTVWLISSCVCRIWDSTVSPFCSVVRNSSLASCSFPTLPSTSDTCALMPFAVTSSSARLPSVSLLHASMPSTVALIFVMTSPFWWICARIWSMLMSMVA